MFKSNQEFLKFLIEEEINYVDFRFTDILGQTHHISYAAASIGLEQLTQGVGFDGSSLPGWKPINDSDMLMVPDVTTAFIDPFSEYLNVCVICDVIDPATNEKYDHDPRSILRAVLSYIQKCGVADAIYIGPELEFFVFDDVKFASKSHSSFYSLDSQESPHNTEAILQGGNLGHRPQQKGGYFPTAPIDSLSNLRSQMCETMAEVGLKPTLHHHEVATSQCEIGIEYSDALSSADNVQKYKYVVKNVAHENQKTATFMPKPIVGDNGSGMHTHISLWSKGENLFYNEQSYGGLSELALYFIGGVIKHARAINAFTNPSTNSYKRLVPGFEAPVHLAYSAKNRSASIRIPHVHSKNAKRIEMRFPDPSCNPYLSFSVLLLAGIDGIINKIHPGEPKDINLYKLDDNDSSSIPKVAGSLKEALLELRRDHDFITNSGAMSKGFIDSYIRLKMEEAQELEMQPHPVEFKLYYSC